MPGRALRTHFVGRRQELVALLSHLDAARQGTGRVVQVAGEPGIGKTRLLAELAERAQAAGAGVLVGHAYESEGLPPYLPFIEVVRDYLRSRNADLLQTEPGSITAQVVLLLPELQDRLPIPAAASSLSPEEERYRLFDAVADLLFTAATATGGLLLILEDLHWADTPSVRLLQHLVRRLPEAPVLLVVSYRTVDLDRGHTLHELLADLSRVPEADRLQLQPLNTADAATFVTMLASVPPLPALLDRIYGETGGNPFFLTEVVRYLEAERYDFTTADAQALPWGVPEGVRAVIGRRLARLDATANQLLAGAAVFGERFSFDELAAMMAAEASSALEAWESVLTAGMVVEQGDSYRFSHALVRQTVYTGLSLPRRQALHLLAAQALELIHARGLGPHLAALAAHYRLGGSAANPQRSYTAAHQAAQAARSVFAHGEAARLLEQALAALTLLDPDDNLRRCDLLLELAQVLTAAGEAKRAASVVAEEAFTLAAAVTDTGRQARAAELGLTALIVDGQGPAIGTPAGRRWLARLDEFAPAESRERTMADGYLAIAAVRAGRYAEARERIERQLTRARRRDDAAALVIVGGGSLGWHLRQEDEAWLLGIAEEVAMTPRQHVPAMPLANALAQQGYIFLQWGRRPAAERAWQELTELATRVREPWAQLLDLAAQASLATLDGRLMRVLELRQAMLALGETTGLTGSVRFMTTLTTWRARQQLGIPIEASEAPAPTFRSMERLLIWGQHDEARRELYRELNRFDAGTDPPRNSVGAVATLLDVALALGEVEVARQLAARVDTLAGMSCSYGVGNCYARLLGGAALLCGKRERAVSYYRQAIVNTAAIGFRPELALSRLDLAAVLQDGTPAERAEAADHLTAVVAEFEAMGMQPALERALALQSGQEATSAGHVDRHRQRYPAGLSEREVEVLRLVASGKSNQEIADELVISLRTVTFHVTNILTRTGCANRTEAAAYAYRTNLAGRQQ